jgi:microcystin-dependent protein
MGDWYVSEIRVFPFNVVPRGWLQCQGQTLQINQYAALYSLIGIQFGGNGTTTFMLPDLRGRVGVSQGAGSTGTQYLAGKAGGQESVAVTLAEMPAHAHTFSGTSAGATTNNPTGALLAAATGSKLGYQAYGSGAHTTLTPASIDTVGGAAAHENRQPYLALNFCIAVQGVYPQRP